MDFKFELDTLKNFFYKKSDKDDIRTVRILGLSMSYVKGSKYRDFAGILEYIKNFVEHDNIDTLIETYRKKGKYRRLSAKQYLNDCKIMEEIVAQVKPDDIPVAEGLIRDIQLRTLDFAKEIISDVEKNTDIKIWLDGGTLLGAVRHKGFIPWDDDMDFAMFRNDYEKLKKYFYSKYRKINTLNWGKYEYSKKIFDVLKQYPNEIVAIQIKSTFKLVRGVPDNFIFLDFFAWDYFNDYHNVLTLQKYSDEIVQKLKSKKTYKEIFQMYDEELKKGINIVEKSDVIMPGIDNVGIEKFKKREIVRFNDIIPLKKAKFEDYEFNIPSNPHIYLKSLYDFYNKIPINGLHIRSHVHTKNL